MVSVSDGAVPSSRDWITPGDRLEEFPMLNYPLALTSFLTRRLGRDDRGASAVEYGLIVALIGAVIVAAVTLLGTQLEIVFSAVAGAL
jgi:pilus assembly protein Flp/PilA